MSFFPLFFYLLHDYDAPYQNLLVFIGTIPLGIIEPKLGVCWVYLLPQPGHQEALLLLPPGYQWSRRRSLQTCVKVVEQHLVQATQITIPTTAKALKMMCVYVACLLTSSPRQCRSPLCYWWLWSCPMYCCHPAGSPLPLSDSPSHRQTAPAQNSDSTVAPGAHMHHWNTNVQMDIPGEHTQAHSGEVTQVKRCIYMWCTVFHSYIRVIQLSSFFFFAFFSVAHCGLAVVVTLHWAEVSFWWRGSCGNLQVRGRGAPRCLTAKQLYGQPLKSGIKKKKKVQDAEHTLL